MKISPARQVAYSLQKCLFCSVSIISLTHDRPFERTKPIRSPAGHQGSFSRRKKGITGFPKNALSILNRSADQ
jgi:hypothetical protein